MSLPTISFPRNIENLNPLGSGGGSGAASELVTTGANVNVGDSGPPITGNILIATSATTATWQLIPAATDLATSGADVNINASAAPTFGQILQADTATDATWQYRGWRKHVRVATTAAGVLATDFEAGDTIDGIVLVDGDRILIKNQASTIENGIYIVQSSGAPVRAGDYAAGTNVNMTFMFVCVGTANAGSGWLCTSLPGSDVVGTDALIYIQFTAGGGGGGESNTASNIGAGGVGLFKSKVGVDLQFKNLNVGSNKLSITDDVGNNEVDFDVIEANLTLDNLGGILGPTKGGTGINNGASTITLGGSISTASTFTTSGAFALILTTTGATNVTLPTTGTLTTLAGTETLTNKTINSTTNTVTADNLHSATTTIDVSGAVAPTVGQVLTATSSTAATWQTSAADANTVTYQVLPLQAVAITTTYTAVGYFPWLDSRYTGYTAGIFVYRVVTGNRSLDIRLQDVTNVATLGSATIGTSTTSTTSFAVTNPTADAQVELQIRKSSGGGTNPNIFGGVLEFDA